MHIADCIELYLAHGGVKATFTTQLEQTQENQLSSVQSGGPGSGRHRTVFNLSDKATGNKVHDALRSLGYHRDMSRSDSHYEHPDGHEIDYKNPNFRVNQLHVHAIGSEPEDEFADIEMHLQEKGLLSY